MPSVASATSRLRARSVRLVDCSLEEHQAAFHGRMQRIDGSARMGMRFTLLERTGRTASSREGARARALAQVQARRRRFGYRQAVRGAPENAGYSMRVNFRWYAATASVIARLSGARLRAASSRRCRTCAECSARPSTKVPGVVRYGVRVTNTAPPRSRPAGPAVGGRRGGRHRDRRPLLPGEEHELDFRGPDCTDAVTAAADPDGVLVESSEDDNVHQFRAPTALR